MGEGIVWNIARTKERKQCVQPEPGEGKDGTEMKLEK